ncbi:hypothetical protein GUITHDRAFT_115076 [Guillardia theta CCMP2712]|uniref:Uncharacterized protein n=1 Tax=Guillardia theta (strain CCMP2712) TaxID=905079 RepID=L1IRN5_GUITC|nr:hypothetical protein GUITHDRAFT_115076 [Guillardia theta CCMP2712]EKX38747.1 hypothetical protein GUITHDRAFT_115076 [Guillardia theta CCMP2712]|eukprot:XP_005825727.1 hypothetical protein GUITHDRAFT_115076 [Guillardia theta CCMP2712]
MGVCVDSCSDGPRAICRILQAIISGIFLFIGIVCQFWSGLNLNDVPLSSLCETYSGDGSPMTQSDFSSLLQWYNTFVGCKQQTCASYEGAASFFLNGNSYASKGSRIDMLRYADARFYCKYAPHQVSSQPQSVTCITKLMSNPYSDPYPCRLWPGQPVATTDNANWYVLPTDGTRGAMYHINCYDKLAVYSAFLKSLYQGTWSDSQIQVAQSEFLQGCVLDKGSDGYILIIGPIFAILGGVITTLTMFKKFNGPPWPEMGMNLLLISIILLLVSFWSISLSTTADISGNYTYCGSSQAPLVNQGRWFDNSPCIDQDSQGSRSWNPFISQLLLLDSVYVAGGVLTFLSTIMYLGLSSGFTESMMSEKFGKYLVTLQDIPMKIRLPFPPKNANPAKQ